MSPLHFYITYWKRKYLCFKLKHHTHTPWLSWPLYFVCMSDCHQVSFLTAIEWCRQHLETKPRWEEVIFLAEFKHLKIQGGSSFLVQFKWKIRMCCTKMWDTTIQVCPKLCPSLRLRQSRHMAVELSHTAGKKQWAAGGAWQGLEDESRAFKLSSWRLIHYILKVIFHPNIYLFSIKL